MASTKPDTTITATDTAPVIEVPPIDPGDAHGIGNTERRPIRPDLLHESAEDAQANGTAFRRG